MDKDRDTWEKDEYVIMNLIMRTEKQLKIIEDMSML